MVAVVDDGGPPPPELRLAWLTERYGSLPEAGGLMDQDAALLTRMTAAGNVYRVVARLRSLVGPQIHSLTDGERKMIRALMDEGLL